MKFVGITLDENMEFQNIYECQICGHRFRGDRCSCYMQEVWEEVRREDDR